MEFRDGPIDPVENAKLIEQQINIQEGFDYKLFKITERGIRHSIKKDIRNKINEKRKIRENKICYLCGSRKTYIYKGKEDWQGYYKEGKLIGLLCINCYRNIQRGIKRECIICKGEFPINRLNAYRDEIGYWDGKSYICQHGCAKSRVGDIDPDGRFATGYITEKLIGKFIGIETCSDVTGKINQQKGYDLWCEDWERIQSKGSVLVTNNGSEGWQFGIHKNIGCDFFFCIGYDRERKHVESVCIIPNNEEICKLSTLFISKSGYSQFEIFKEDVNPWDDLFHTMKLNDCPAMKNSCCI